MDRFTEIMSFALIADKGSFAAAASQMDVTPVVMGRRLTALEKRLNVCLMHRSTRGLSLTPQGEKYLAECRVLIRNMEAADENISAEQAHIRGRLTVSAPAHFGRRHVAALAPLFLQKHPEIHLSFSLSDAATDLIEEGFDMGVRIGIASPQDYVAVPLYPGRRVVCATPAYLAKNGVPKTLEDLAHHNCLAFNQHRGRPIWRFLDNGKSREVIVSGNLSCNDSELLFEWVAKGLGLSWRSVWEVETQLKSGELVEVLNDFALPTQPIQAVFPKQQFLPKKVRAFVDFLKETYNRADYWEEGD